MKYLSIFIRVALLALGQSLDCHSASEVSLVDMGKSVNVLPQQSTAKHKPCAYFLGCTVDDKASILLILFVWNVVYPFYHIVLWIRIVIIKTKCQTMFPETDRQWKKCWECAPKDRSDKSHLHVFHIPQCTIQNRDVQISVLNGALWDMKLVYCGICARGQMALDIVCMKWSLTVKPVLIMNGNVRTCKQLGYVSNAFYFQNATWKTVWNVHQMVTANNVWRISSRRDQKSALVSLSDYI